MGEKLTGADKVWGFRFGVDGVLTVQEALKHLSISRSKLYELFNEGKFRRGHIGRKVVICRRSIQEYLKTIEW